MVSTKRDIRTYSMGNVDTYRGLGAKVMHRKSGIKGYVTGLRGTLGRKNYRYRIKWVTGLETWCRRKEVRFQ